MSIENFRTSRAIDASHYSQENVIARFNKKNPNILSEEMLDSALDLAVLILNNPDDSKALKWQKTVIANRINSKYGIEVKVDVLVGKLLTLCLKLQKRFSELPIDQEESAQKCGTKSIQHRLGGKNSSFIKLIDHEKNEIPYFILDKMQGGAFNDVRYVIDIETIETKVFRTLKNPEKNKPSWIKEVVLHGSLQEKISGLVKISRIFPNYGAISMERMETDLCDLATLSPLSDQVIIDIMRQILEIVDKFHKNNMMHGDLKMENFLVSKKESSYVVKICDLGATVPLSNPYRMCGTFAFLPPEAFYFEKTRDNAKIDVFSLGMLLYQLVNQNTFEKHEKCLNEIKTVVNILRDDQRKKGVFLEYAKANYPDIELDPENSFKNFDAILEKHFIAELSSIYSSMLNEVRNPLFQKLLNGLLDVNPEPRFSIEEAMKELQAIKI